MLFLPFSHKVGSPVFLPAQTYFSRQWLPGLLVTVLTIFLVHGCLAGTALANPTPVQKYESAKREMERLEKDAKRSTWREPWEKLAKTFLDIYENNAAWTNRPAALFRSALAMEELGKRSRLRKDTLEALARYERLVKEAPASPLADDALYRAARLNAERLSDVRSALVLLKQISSKYSGSDMAPAATSYTKELLSLLAKQSETATLVKTSWRDNNGFVQLVLNFDKPVAWSVKSRSQDKKNGTPDRLIVELSNTVPASTIRPSAKASNSLLRHLRVDLTTPETTRLLLDFRKLRRFAVTTKTAPFRLVITGSPTDKGMPGGVSLGGSLRSEPHLFLKKITVMLDPGHGGKDPGTIHNGIVESELALDIAKRVGRLLEAREIRVLHTRIDNSWISLDARTHMANEADADIFVSIHVNASDKEEASGFEIYVPSMSKTAAKNTATSQNGEKRPFDRKSADRCAVSGTLAGHIQKEVEKSLAKHNFSISSVESKQASFRVLSDISMPGVLLEIGYCSNKQEAKNLASPAYRGALATGIAEGILGMVQILNGLE